MGYSISEKPGLLKGYEGTLLAILRKYLRNLYDYGFATTTRKTIAFLLRPVYQKVVYFLYELDINTPYDERLDNDGGKYRFKMIGRQDTDAIAQIEHMEEWLRGTFTEKLKTGCLCLAIFHADKVIGFNYAVVGEGNIPLLRLKMKLKPTEAWSEQISVSKEYRRQGIAKRLRQRFYRELKQRDITALYGHRQEANTASAKSAKKFTADILAKVNYIKILNRHRLKFILLPDNASHIQRMISAKPGRSKGAEKPCNSTEKTDALFEMELDDIR